MASWARRISDGGVLWSMALFAVGGYEGRAGEGIKVELGRERT